MELRSRFGTLNRLYIFTGPSQDVREWCWEHQIAYQCHFGGVLSAYAENTLEERIFMDFYTPQDAFAFKMRWV
ncbi:MAG: hypothetical protein EOP83_28000 [Verrucomicrobiaceae bacterium]|nr:MAG: hypothetical protein EOP83_28000 [Verrucomicrobiaceae bacterium]